MTYQAFIDYVMQLAIKTKTFVKTQNDRENGRYIAKFTGGVKMIVNPNNYQMLTIWANGNHRASKNIRKEVEAYG